MDYNYSLLELLQKMLLAILASVIPITFANFMVWKRKLPPNLSIRSLRWKKRVRSWLVIMVVCLQYSILFFMDTNDLFEPEPRLGMILLTTTLLGALVTVVMTLLFVMDRNARNPREEKDMWSVEE